MASQFQNRLLGTVILATIGVIILPSILDGEKSHYQEESSVISIMPGIETNNENKGAEISLMSPEIAPIEEQDLIATQNNTDDEWVAQVEVENSENDIQDKEIIQEPTDEMLTQQSTNQQQTSLVGNDKSVTPQLQDSAWVIQLMSLKNKENAIKLVEDLKSRGYMANYQETSTGWIRVIVGPDSSKQILEKQVNELEKITGSKGVLKVYTP